MEKEDGINRLTLFCGVGQKLIKMVAEEDQFLVQFNK